MHSPANEDLKIKIVHLEDPYIIQIFLLLYKVEKPKHKKVKQKIIISVAH